MSISEVNFCPGWKSIVGGYSLANLWFIGSWKELTFSSTYHYFDAAPHNIYEFVAVFVNVLALTVVFAGLLHLATTSSRGTVRTGFRLIFLAMGLTAYCALSFELVVWLYPAAISYGNLPLPALVLTGCVLLAISHEERLRGVVENLRHLSYLLLPFSLLLLLQAGVSLVTVDEREYLPTHVEKQPSDLRPADPPDTDRPAADARSERTRVVWLIFDELDYSALKVAEETIGLPGFTSLEGQSLTASNAFSPSDETLTSIPSLLTGLPVRTAEHNDKSDLLLITNEGQKLNLADTDNIFTELRPLGVRSGIVGWYHPYSRVFNGDASSIHWAPYSDINRCSDGIDGFGSCMIGIFLRSLVQVPFANKLYPPLMYKGEEFMGKTPQSQMRAYITQKATAMIADPDLDLVFVHFSIPHDPFIKPRNYNGSTNYFSALLAVDRTLLAIRDAVDKGDAANRTVLVVSSDHRWRQKKASDFEFLDSTKIAEVVEDRRIPFIVNFPNQNFAVPFEPRLNTIVSHAVVKNIFTRKIKGPRELESWLRGQLATAPGASY